MAFLYKKGVRHGGLAIQIYFKSYGCKHEYDQLHFQTSRCEIAEPRKAPNERSPEEQEATRRGGRRGLCRA